MTPDDDSSTTTMRAAVVPELGAPLTVTDLPLPEPGPGEALVRLDTSGVCHTDLHAARGDWPVIPQPPFVPGHEGYGTGLIHPTVETARLEDINEVFARMERGQIDGRIVIDYRRS